MEDLKETENGTFRTKEDEIFVMANAFVECVAITHGIPVDFSGLKLNVLRCPDTYRLMAVVITPVDNNAEGEPVPRYVVEPGQIRKADLPKIVLNG